MIESIEAINRIKELQQSKEWKHLPEAIKQKQINKLNYHFSVIGKECGWFREVMLRVANGLVGMFTTFAQMLNEFIKVFSEWKWFL